MQKKSKEEWRTLSDWPGYSVSSFGRVKREEYKDPSGNIQKELVLSRTYLVKDRFAPESRCRGPYYRLRCSGDISFASGAHLVAAGFFDGWDSKKYAVTFKDSNPDNIAKENLEIMTKIEFKLLRRERRGQKQ